MSGHDVKNIPKLILSFFHILPLKQNPTISRTICSPLNKWFLIPEPEWGGRQRRYKTKYSLGNNRSMTYQGFFFIKVGLFDLSTWGAGICHTYNPPKEVIIIFPYI